MGAQLLLYICIRFGNPFDEDGANGDDTIVLVRAPSHTAAGEVADEFFRGFPSRSAGGISLHKFCHRIVRVGEDACGPSASSAVLTHWVGNNYPPAEYERWCRGEIPGEFVWRTMQEVYGDDAA